MKRGVLVVLGIALGVAVALGVPMLQQRFARIHVVATIPEAPGVRRGAPVQYRGVPVGSVEAITFADSVVVLVLRLDRTDVPLRNTDRIEVNDPPIFGPRGVVIVPSQGAGRPWRDGDTLVAVARDTIAEVRAVARREFIDAAVRKFFSRDSTDSTPRGPPPVHR